MAATVLAFQSRKVRQEFNESSRLGFVVYSQFLFLVLRTIIWSFGSFLTANVANAIASYLLSADVIVTICIYFVPKLLDAMKPQENFNDSRSISYYSERDTRSNQLGRRLSTVEVIRIDHAREKKEWEERAGQYEVATRRGSGCSRISMDSNITMDTALCIAKRRASHLSVDTNITMDTTAKRRSSFLEGSVAEKETEGSIIAEEGTIVFEYDGTIKEEDDDCGGEVYVEGLLSLKNIDNDISV